MRQRRCPPVRAWLILLLVFARQSPAQPPADDVGPFVSRLRESLAAGNERALAALFSADLEPEAVERYTSDLMTPGATRRLFRELDRATPEGATPTNARRLVFELLEEWPGHARMLTAALTLRRVTTDPDDWRLTGVERLGTIDGLYRLRLDTEHQYEASNVSITAPDLTLTLKSGAIFLLNSDDGVAGLVLMGNGEMRFAPQPAAERGQVRLFAGADTLVTPFENALVRIHPADYLAQIPPTALRPVRLNADLARRAAEVVDRELPKALTVDLAEFGSTSWSLLPRQGDILADIRTRRHGTLTYSRFGAQAEDVSLISRARRLTISIYASAGNIAARGRFYREDDLREFDVVDTRIDASVSPGRNFLRATAQLTIRAVEPTSALTLRLANDLVITSIGAVGIGPLSHVRLRSQNAVMVRVPTIVMPGRELVLRVSYSGLVTSQPLDTETLQIVNEPQGLMPERHLLLSSGSYWYPQNPFTDYATATLRIAVPRDYTVIASGAPGPAPTDFPEALATSGTDRVFAFRADRPLRYLAMVASRFVSIHQESLDLGAADGPRQKVSMEIAVNPLQRGTGRELVAPVSDVLRFYSGLLGDAPFESATVAILESNLPGGHSPGYFAMLNRPVVGTPVTWQNDPATFPGFPEFFLAHELAHQWWGHAVGGSNYHERWLSEGMAQYFAALYAQRARGDRVFQSMLRQFRRWSISESDKGPIHLGYRLGQLEGGPRVLRALVYNKGAGVLHMLRRFVGDDAFFRGLRRFYQDHKFATASSDDLRKALESEGAPPLDRFFERWVYESDLPRVVDRSRIVDGLLTIRLELTNAAIYDLPITATVLFEDGSTRDMVVVMTDRVFELALREERRVRNVQFNRDSGALAEIGD